MSEHGVNVLTRWIVLGPFVLWAVWELVLVALRGAGWDVRLISQEARSLAYRGLPSLAYFMAGLAVHFFVNWTRPTWDGRTATVLGLLWWGVGFAYLAADVFDPSRFYWPLVTRWLRWPPVAALMGASSFLAFPQRALWEPWRMR